MENNSNELHKEINERILNDLDHVEDAVEVVNFISRFQHLSSINWKWVRSQNQRTELLLTDKVIKKNGFEINDDATITWIYVPHKIDGRRKFVEEPRYDISQTNANITDFPNRIPDYTLDENREILSRTLNMGYIDLRDHFHNQSAQAFSDQNNLSDELKNVLSELMSHVVNGYFGIDTTERVKPVIEDWLAMKQGAKSKISVIDSVHHESKRFIAEIEQELDKTRAEMKVYRKIGTKLPQQTTINREKPVKNNNEEPFSFDKLKKDLRLNELEDFVENNTTDTLDSYSYKESQGAYNFINFLDKVEQQNPNLLKSQSVITRGFGNDGLMYDALTSATYSIGDLHFEFSGNDDVLKVHGGGKNKEYSLLDGSLPIEFEVFKKTVLDKVEELQPKVLRVEKETLSKTSKNNFKAWSDAVESASHVALLRFAEANGYCFKKTGRNRYTCIEHESLIITPSLNRFYYFSGDFGGDTIKFAQDMMGIKGFKEAVNYINSGDYPSADKEAHKYPEIKKEAYVYDKSNESKDFSKAYHYLVNERKIVSEYVNYFHHKGLMKQDQKGNIIFPYMKAKEIVGAALQGTYIKEDGSTFKQIQANSSGDQGFNYLNGSPKNLKFFEAPIDLLSYMSLHKHNPEKMRDTWFVAMGGLKESVVQNYFREAQEQLAKFAVNQMLQSVDGDVATADVVFKEKGVSPNSIKDVLENAGLSQGNYGTIQDYVTNNFQSVSICVDNDEKGLVFEEKIQQACKMFKHLEYFNDIPKIPIEKATEGIAKWDWNHELKFQIYKAELEQERQVMDDFVEVGNSNDKYISADVVSHEYSPQRAQMSMEI